MITDYEKDILKQIFDIENLQRAAMVNINNILKSIPNIMEEGEDQNPELKLANEHMKYLIMERMRLMSMIGITPVSPLPDNIEKHYLEGIV